ncbi:hypothetical protein F4677DRAFT_436024 [Hypoxylon crocopeplum]|nr:hypothetical protein F4677DRAFT_436024 [Hypoxylon crocopeplum]
MHEEGFAHRDLRLGGLKSLLTRIQNILIKCHPLNYYRWVKICNLGLSERIGKRFRPLEYNIGRYS